VEHVAIDLGGRESQVCVRREDGTILEEKRWPTRDLGTYLAGRPPSRVVVETCAEGFYVADLAVSHRHETRVVPATLVRSLGVGERGLKSDKRDARKLSEVSCRIDLPTVHIPSTESRELKTRLGMRDALVAARTMFINTVRGWLRASAVAVPKSAKAFVLHVREAVGPTLPSYVERQLQMIDTLSDQVREADKEIALLTKQHPVCPRLMSVPGIGPVTALHFVAVIDDAKRFKGAHDVGAYLGLTPGQDSSSNRQRTTGITKAGSTSLRRCLVQAAWAARRAHGNHPMVDWSLQVEKRRGKRIAIVAFARKLAGILFALWRDGTFYAPGEAARALPDLTPSA
jgi:transposase